MPANNLTCRQAIDIYLASVESIPDVCLPLIASSRALADRQDNEPSAHTGRELRVTLDRLHELLGDEPPPPSELDRILASRERRLARDDDPT